MIQSKNPITAMSVIFLSFVLGYFTKEVLCILGKSTTDCSDCVNQNTNPLHAARFEEFLRIAKPYKSKEEALSAYLNDSSLPAYFRNVVDALSDTNRCANLIYRYEKEGAWQWNNIVRISSYPDREDLVCRRGMELDTFREFYCAQLAFCYNGGWAGWTMAGYLWGTRETRGSRVLCTAFAAIPYPFEKVRYQEPSDGDGVWEMYFKSARYEPGERVEREEEAVLVERYKVYILWLLRNIRLEVDSLNKKDSTALGLKQSLAPIKGS